jgi:hypothetical protein
MGYYDSQETVVTVIQHWHVRVAARRYFNQAIAELKEKASAGAQVHLESFWKQVQWLSGRPSFFRH